MRLRTLLLVPLLLGVDAAAAELVLDAAPGYGLRPAHLQAAVPYPVVVHAEFVIDRIGRARDIRIDPSTPSLFADSVRRALDQPQAFWPAQGQCRFLEQDARMVYEFGAPAAGATVEVLEFVPLTVRAPSTAPIAQADAHFVRTSTLDQRARPVLEGHPTNERPPVAKTRIKPRIPDELRHSQGLGGYVWLAFEVSAKGRPRDITVHDAWAQVAGKEKHLGIEAARALRDVEFEPALRDGVPVARRSCQFVSFSITAWAADDR